MHPCVRHDRHQYGLLHVFVCKGRGTQDASSALQLHTRKGWAELDDCGPSFVDNATSASLEETLPERCYLVKRSHLLRCICRLLADCVAKLFCASERERMIQGRQSRRNID